MPKRKLMIRDPNKIRKPLIHIITDPKVERNPWKAHCPSAFPVELHRPFAIPYMALAVPNVPLTIARLFSTHSVHSVPC